MEYTSKSASCDFSSKFPDIHDKLGTIYEIIPSPVFRYNRFTQDSIHYEKFLYDIWKLRETVYSKRFHEICSFKNDEYDLSSCVFFIRNNCGEISSTARIAFNGSLGIPDNDKISELTNALDDSGVRYAEIGRLASNNKPNGVINFYLRAFYEIGIECGINIYLLLIEGKRRKYYEKMMNAKVLMKLPGITYGSGEEFICMSWELKNTPELFFERTKTMKNSMENDMNKPYDKQIWNRYATSHLSVTTSFQLNLMTDTANYLRGDVVDCGCGTAKIAPILAGNNRVESYTGVDYSDQMVEIATLNIRKLKNDNFHVVHSKIEDLKGGFDSALSIHSYYTWPDTELVLKAIYSLLKEGGLFVLATPNKDLNMPVLVNEVEKEQGGHPNFEDFKKINLMLAENPNANFVSMDDLISQVRSVGFKVEECHQRHYLNGVNFLVLRK